MLNYCKRGHATACNKYSIIESRSSIRQLQSSFLFLFILVNNFFVVYFDKNWLNDYMKYCIREPQKLKIKKWP